VRVEEDIGQIPEARGQRREGRGREQGREEGGGRREEGGQGEKRGGSADLNREIAWNEVGVSRGPIDESMVVMVGSR
jgi:hypothetical protein